MCSLHEDASNYMAHAYTAKIYDNPSNDMDQLLSTFLTCSNLLLHQLTLAFPSTYEYSKKLCGGIESEETKPAECW